MFFLAKVLAGFTFSFFSDVDGKGRKRKEIQLKRQTLYLNNFIHRINVVKKV